MYSQTQNWTTDSATAPCRTEAARDALLQDELIDPLRGQRPLLHAGRRWLPGKHGIMAQISGHRARRAVLASTPGRAGIAGNPSDMYGGRVVSITTVERAFCEVRHAQSVVLQSGALVSSIVSDLDLAAQGDSLDIARAVLRWLGVHSGCGGMSIRTWSEIPPQAGLGGSSALMVATLSALDRWFGHERTLEELVDSAHAIEFHELRCLCGFQDHAMAVFGGLRHMDFEGKEDLSDTAPSRRAVVRSVQHPGCPPPLVVAHSAVRHSSGNVHAEPYRRWSAGDETYRSGYRHLADLSDLAIRAIEQADWQLLGRLMNENHALVRDLGGSHEANERLIDAALGAGAFGAKLAGAGGGGTVVALAEDLPTVSRALLDAGASQLLYPRPSHGLAVVDR